MFSMLESFGAAITRTTSPSARVRSPSGASGIHWSRQGARSRWRRSIRKAGADRGLTHPPSAPRKPARPTTMPMAPPIRIDAPWRERPRPVRPRPFPGRRPGATALPVCPCRSLQPWGFRLASSCPSLGSCRIGGGVLHAGCGPADPADGFLHSVGVGIGGHVQLGGTTKPD